MSRQDNLATISVEDVLHTLRECQRDWKYSGRFEPMLAFASELTGISEDSLSEMMYAERSNDGGIKIIDRLDGVTDGVVYVVQVAPERFVDVKVCEDGTVDFLSKINGATRVFSHVYDAEGLYIVGGVEFDMEAALSLVKEYVNEPASRYPNNFKEILISSIRDVLNDHNVLYQEKNIEALAAQVMCKDAFSDRFSSYLGIQHLDDGSEKYMDAVWACYDYAEEEILPTLLPSVESKIAEAKEASADTASRSGGRDNAVAFNGNDRDVERE